MRKHIVRLWGDMSWVYSHGSIEQHVNQNKSNNNHDKLYLPWILASQKHQRDQGGRWRDTAEDRDDTLRTLNSLYAGDACSVHCHYVPLTGARLKTYQKVTAKIMKSTRKSLTEGGMTTHIKRDLWIHRPATTDPLGGGGRIQSLTIFYRQHQLSNDNNNHLLVVHQGQKVQEVLEDPPNPEKQIDSTKISSIFSTLVLNQWREFFMILSKLESICNISAKWSRLVTVITISCGRPLGKSNT